MPEPADNAHETTKQQAARWLQQVLDHTGWNAARLAREAGLSPSTISRGIDRESKFVPTLPTLQAVARAAKLPPPPELNPAGYHAPGFADEPEVVALPSLTSWCGMPLNNHQWVARVTSRSLDLLGLLPGDEVLLDQTATAQAGDVVCVQTYNLDRNTAETVLRHYAPPYVTTETTDPAARERPLLVDNERTKIMAVMIRMARLRTAAD